MDNMGKLVLSLALVTIASALLLTGVALWTDPIIEENIARMHQEVLEDFFPEMDSYHEKTVDDVKYDFVYDSEEEFLGVLALARASGYAGEIVYYLAVCEQGTVEGISIRDHEETPGIGDIIEDPEFQDRLVGKHYQDSLEPEEDVDTVSGATVSTETMIESVGEHLELVSDEVLDIGREKDF